MRYDALIIGAGMSGLAAGIRLAQFDRRVAVLERHYLWGGLNSFYKLAGRRFDSGLHALTNYVPKGRRGPLTQVLRQLRIPYDALQLQEQSHSEIAFRSERLKFSNDLDLLRSEIARAFPAEVDRFEAFLEALPPYNGVEPAHYGESARERVEAAFEDPLLSEMLLCPVCFYGSAREHDIDWATFVILFRSIFLEGFARPEGGIKPLLDLLVTRFKEVGGELRMRTGVRRLLVKGGAVRGVVLDDGTELEADLVLSSAGWVETQRLAGAADDAHDADIGKISVVESLSVVDRHPRDLGLDLTALFYNDADTFRYEQPDDLVDTVSGVLCTPDNYGEQASADGVVRVTYLANHDLWSALPEEQYRAEKERVSAQALERVTRFVPDFRSNVTFQDVFTPRTIRKFTGHLGGALYGSPAKLPSGRTDVDNLFLIGTDEGPIGIIGAMLSGIRVANGCALASPTRS